MNYEVNLAPLCRNGIKKFLNKWGANNVGQMIYGHEHGYTHEGRGREGGREGERERERERETERETEREREAESPVCSLLPI